MWRLILVLVSLVLLGINDGAVSSVESTTVSDGTLRRIDVPILMYHYVSPLPDDADIYRVDLTVSPEMFRAHVAYLSAEGYTAITLADLYNALMTGARLPDKPIILTFDDGYSDHYQYVLPVLQEFEMVGTFFVITGRADNPSSAHLTWEQIETMAQAGMEIASHTKTHPDLREREYDFLVYQILGSVESIEAHIERQTIAFSYPAGRYDVGTLAVLEQTPVGIAVTTRSGRLHTTDGILELPRIRVSENLSVASLAFTLGD